MIHTYYKQLSILIIFLFLVACGDNNNSLNSAEENILKTLDKLKPRHLIPRKDGDEDFKNPTLTELSPLYIELLQRVNASPGLTFIAVN